MSDNQTINLEAEIKKIKTQMSTETLRGEELRSKYLGKNGLFNQVAQVMKNADTKNVDSKRQMGQLLNDLRQYLESEITAKNSQAKSSEPPTANWVDLTAPGIIPKVGHVHPISQAMAEITHIFELIGFTRVRYPEVDWDHYVFEALNMPPNHPARDEWETFFVEAAANAPIDVATTKKWGTVVLTTQTSKRPSTRDGKIALAAAN